MSIPAAAEEYRGTNKKNEKWALALIKALVSIPGGEPEPVHLSLSKTGRAQTIS